MPSVCVVVIGVHGLPGEGVFEGLAGGGGRRRGTQEGSWLHAGALERTAFEFFDIGVHNHVGHIRQEGMAVLRIKRNQMVGNGALDLGVLCTFLIPLRAEKVESVGIETCHFLLAHGEGED